MNHIEVYEASITVGFLAKWHYYEAAQWLDSGHNDDPNVVRTDWKSVFKERNLPFLRQSRLVAPFIPKADSPERLRVGSRSRTRTVAGKQRARNVPQVRSSKLVLRPTRDARSTLMTKRFEILKERDVFRQAIFTVREAHLRHEKYDGTMSEEIVRLNLERGDSVAAIVHDVARDLLYFTEQFRYPTIANSSGWLLELPAGAVDAGETPEETLARELLEEIGVNASAFQPIGTFFASPGGSSERILLYYASVDQRARVTDGGGSSEEGEDIRVVTMPVAEAMDALADQRIEDAKTIIGLQWLALAQATHDSGGHAAR